MSGPWERYQSGPQNQEGPWSRYAQNGPQNPEWQARTRARARGLEPVNADPTADMSFAEQAAAGAGLWLMEQGRGIGQRLGFRDGEDTAQQRELDAALRDTPGGRFGEFAAPIAATLPVAGVGALNTLRGATAFGAGYGAMQPTETAGETATNIGLGGLFGLGGQWVGNRVGNALGNRLNTRQTNANNRAGEMAVRDGAIQAGREAGLITPPSTANPSVVNRALESVSGKQATANTIMEQNSETVNRMVREQLGIPAGTPITRRVIDDIINGEAAVYRQIDNAPDIRTDDEALDALSGLMQTNERVRRGYPDLDVEDGEAIERLVNGLLVESVPAASARATIAQLRRDAGEAFRAGRAGLGRARNEAAEILEENMLRNLRANGLDDVAEQFDGARRRMAIAYTARDAVDEGAGMIDPRKLATRFRNGRPISGEMETIARFAENVPQAMRIPKSSPASLVNAGVTGAAGLGALASGANALGALATMGLWPAARMGARSLIMSRPYQARMLQRNYAPNKLGTLMLQGSRYAANRGGPLAAVIAANQ